MWTQLMAAVVAALVMLFLILTFDNPRNRP
jgi:hypothetical protein